MTDTGFLPPAEISPDGRKLWWLGFVETHEMDRELDEDMKEMQ